MVFGINSMSSAVRKFEIVRGEAKCYLTLPDLIASAITVIWLYFALKIFRILLFCAVLISYALHNYHNYINI